MSSYQAQDRSGGDVSRSRKGHVGDEVDMKNGIGSPSLKRRRAEEEQEEQEQEQEQEQEVEECRSSDDTASIEPTFDSIAWRVAHGRARTVRAKRYSMSLEDSSSDWDLAPAGRRNELRKFKAEMALHKDKLEKLQTSVAEWQNTQRTAHRDELARAKEEAAELHAMLDRLRHEHEESNREGWKKAVELTLGRDEGTRRENELRAELVRLQEAATAREATVRALEKTVAALHADAAEQEDRKLAEAAGLHGENARLHSENATLNGGNAELHRELARLRKEHAALCTKASGMKAKNAELEAEIAGLREKARDNQVGRPGQSSSDL